MLLSVRDTGKPIPEADLSRVFDPWSHARSGISRTGISLAPLYRFAVLNGGAAEVRSCHSEGATYLLSFPALIASPPHIEQPGFGRTE